MVSSRFRTRDNQEVAFREPQSLDARALMRFINQIAVEPMSGITVNKRVTLKDEKVWLKNILTGIRRGTTIMLVVEADGAIVGNCHVERRKDKRSHRAVLGIALAEKWRGKGIGEALTKKAIELARKRMPGLDTIELSFLDYNKRASMLYRKLGFVEIGRIPRSVREGSKYFDEHLMLRRL